jgi:hypothetical protein
VYFAGLHTIQLQINFVLNNCRGLHYIAKNVNERVKLIPDELKDYDIIGLQEVGGWG